MAHDTNKLIADGLDMGAARALIESRIQLMGVAVAEPESDTHSPRRCKVTVGGPITFMAYPTDGEIYWRPPSVSEVHPRPEDSTEQ
jgi:hypothetical protein